jgi:hypothetical protein
MKFSVMIPQHDNNGQPFDQMKLGGIYSIFWLRFGGCTVDAVADGYWQGDDGKLYVDKMRRVTVVVQEPAARRILEIRKVVREVGSMLGQKVMYFEHDANGKVEVEFLSV